MSNVVGAAADPPLRIRIAAGLGLGGVVLLMTLALRSPPALYLGLFLALAGLALAAERALPVLAREPLVWLVLLLFVWVFLRGWVDLATADARGMAPEPGAIWHHARYTPLLAFVFGLWLAAYWRYRNAIMLLVGAGTLIYVVRHWERMAHGLPGGEGAFSSAFGEAGVIAATTTFITAAVAVGIWRAGTGAGHRLLRPTLVGLAIGLCLFALATLIGAQARSAWLATLGALLVLGLAGGWYLVARADARQRRIALATAGGGLCVVGLAVALSWEVLSSRMAQDSETVAVLLSGDVEPEDVPGGSFGTRYHMLRQGLIDAGAHPWWGVGPASIRDMLHEAWGKPLVGSGNYHSTWLNLLVAMGIPWTVLWIGAHVWALWRAVRALGGHGGDAVLAVGLVGAALAHFGTLSFQTRIWSAQGAALYLILMTLICAAVLHGPVQRRRLAASANDDVGATPAPRS